MILARRNEQWFLAAFAKHIRGCHLSSNARPQEEYEHFHLWKGRVFVWSHAPVENTRFFPEIRFRSARVYPECWTRDSSEPILRCRMMPWDSYSAGYTDEQQKADDWQCVGSPDGATKWIHVDELGKIEGPPPEGAF